MTVPWAEVFAEIEKLRIEIQAFKEEEKNE